MNTNTKEILFLCGVTVIVCILTIFAIYSIHQLTLKPATEFCAKKGLGTAKDWEILSPSVAGVECSQGGIILTGYERRCVRLNKWDRCVSREIYLLNDNLAGEWQ